MRTEHDAALAILGLDPDSAHPYCDWREKEERHRLRPEVRGRWFMHTDCYVDAESKGLPSLQMSSRQWVWTPASPAPACNVRSTPRPPALTEEQILQVVSLQQWKLTQLEIVERLGVNQASVCQALVKAEGRGQMPAKVQGEQSAIDWFREVA